MPDRESQQVNVGQLSRPMNSARIRHILIQQANVIRPEFMDILAARGG